MSSLYTDGAYSSMNGIGGTAFVAVSNSAEIHSESQTYMQGDFTVTSQRMELQAAIHALIWGQTAWPYRTLHVYSDSQYLVNCMTKWLDKWIANGWVKANGEPVANQDLLEQLTELTTGRYVRWHWVRGHNGNQWNERADELAFAASQKEMVVA